MRIRLIRRGIAVAAVVVAAFTAAVGSAAGGHGAAGAVYTLSNGAGGSAVLVFDRSSDGTLVAAGSVATGGLGTGAGLGSQGALVLSPDARWLFAVNAGSNEISAFAVRKDGLSLVSKIGSEGVRPISLTFARGLLYVLNEGDASHPGNIVGFGVGPRGELSLLSGSTRPLSGASVGPAQIQFNPSGRVLVVTEKTTNSIDTYLVGNDGLATGPNVQASAAQTPFGFDFDPHGRLVVSDAVGSAPGASGLSSYGLDTNGQLTAITPFAPDTQTAACWVVTTKDGRYAYTTNTGSASVSSYSIAPDGSLALLEAVAGATGAGPIDAARTRNSRFLYTLDTNANTISAFAIQENGSLTPVSGAAGLPAGAVGLAAR
jgi:6-phosphogluconolactonase (cycloisomerase 2 family)